ncbi:hypothetical protein F4824DRAFT_509569 [Ustulina deusta]|nr:hypothetical protein F4824DRAFT_509569 [Ustulina deusta]
MSTQQTNSERPITQPPVDREYAFHTVIKIHDTPPAQSSVTRHESACSSLGVLDILPAELLLLTFELLDFQSLSRLSRVSLKGKVMVEALTAYRDMMEHAPTTLTALAKTRLISHHSASLLRQTLRSAKCVSCFEFGGYLLLPTCERVCAECLLLNQALWMTSVPLAKRCFSLTDAQIERIPIMYSIPGYYGIRFSFQRHKTRRLVNVKQAKQLGIEVHRSIDQMSRLLSGKCPGMPSTESWVPNYFLEAPLEPPGSDMPRLATKHKYQRYDQFSGIACIRFPYLTQSGLDNGLFCQGCERTYEDHQRGILPASVLSELAPPGVDTWRVIRGLVYRMRSRDGFLEHVRHCYGARRVMDELRED